MVFVSLRLGLALLNEPRKIAEGAQSVPTLLAVVELPICRAPSVWKIAPPCQPVEVLPRNVLLLMLALPSGGFGDDIVTSIGHSSAMTHVNNYPPRWT